ncbi:hypothetical protein C942_00430 [Photobacterium marinum]|uniref:Uncharacterized protein n=1 Tax=Photobacterium marinum TaxID=1056511 RepID=L8JB12_9GAMM|nr:hypothetical protein C942_00430 [Photobacterium marinum]
MGFKKCSSIRISYLAIANQNTNIATVFDLISFILEYYFL